MGCLTTWRIFVVRNDGKLGFWDLRSLLGMHEVPQAAGTRDFLDIQREKMLHLVRVNRIELAIIGKHRYPNFWLCGVVN